MTKFYIESVGECVSQVYELEEEYGITAEDWEDAKEKAYKLMNEGDILAECEEEAVERMDNRPDNVLYDYHKINEDKCDNYAKLSKGAYLVDENGEEYFNENVWQFSDNLEVVYGLDEEED